MDAYMGSISEIALWVVLSALALQTSRSLGKVAKWSHLNANPGRRNTPPRLATGSQAPAFSAPEWSGGGRVASDEFQGQPTMLVFVSLADVASATYEHLGSSLHGLWHKAQGKVVVLCHGDADGCRTLLAPHLAKLHGEPAVRVGLDAGGAIARRYRVTRTPMAVGIDEKGDIAMVGVRRTAEELETMVQPRPEEIGAN